MRFWDSYVDNLENVTVGWSECCAVCSDAMVQILGRLVNVCSWLTLRIFTLTTSLIIGLCLTVERLLLLLLRVVATRWSDSPWIALRSVSAVGSLLLTWIDPTDIKASFLLVRYTIDGAISIEHERLLRSNRFIRLLLPCLTLSYSWELIAGLSILTWESNLLQRWWHVIICIVKHSVAEEIRRLCWHVSYVKPIVHLLPCTSIVEDDPVTTRWQLLSSRLRDRLCFLFCLFVRLCDAGASRLWSLQNRLGLFCLHLTCANIASIAYIWLFELQYLLLTHDWSDRSFNELIPRVVTFRAIELFPFESVRH
jgi:hypothetical protein